MRESRRTIGIADIVLEGDELGDGQLARVAGGTIKPEPPGTRTGPYLSDPDLTLDYLPPDN